MNGPRIAEAQTLLQRWLSPRWLVVGVLLVTHLFLSLSSAVHESLTYDESAHFRYGEQLLRLNSDRFDDSKMPISALNALVVRAARAAFPSQMTSIWQDMRVGRVSTALFSVLVGLLIYRWSSELYGPHAGIASLVIYVFEPNILAHSRLITTDLFMTGMGAATVYAFWKFLEDPKLKTGIISATVLALAQLAKYTAVFLYPLLPLLALLFFRGEIQVRLRTSGLRALLPGLRAAVWYTLLFIVISLVVVNAGFVFNRTFTPISQFSFQSELFQFIQSNLQALVDLPIPVPYPYVEGLDLVRYRERTGEGYAGIYLLGEVRDGRGFPGYFFIAALFKLPLVVLAAFLLSIARSLLPRRPPGLREREIFLLLPAVYFLVYFNFLFRAQLGIRFVLVVFPFLIILTGNLFEEWPRLDLKRKAVAVIAGLYFVGSVLSYYPHFISYFNEIVWDRKYAFEYLADSNLDYGQSKAYLDRYLADHPEAILEPTRPTTGLIVVSANWLSGQRGGREAFAWLRENYEPLGHIAYSYLIFQVDELPDADPSETP